MAGNGDEHGKIFAGAHPFGRGKKVPPVSLLIGHVAQRGNADPRVLRRGGTNQSMLPQLWHNHISTLFNSLSFRPHCAQTISFARKGVVLWAKSGRPRCRLHIGSIFSATPRRRPAIPLMNCEIGFDAYVACAMMPILLLIALERVRPQLEYHLVQETLRSASGTLSYSSMATCSYCSTRVQVRYPG